MLQSARKVCHLRELLVVPLGLEKVDENGESHPIVMGCYGIGSDRLIATIVEHHHDEAGIQWPITVAPYQIALISLANDKSPEVAEAAEAFAEELGVTWPIALDTEQRNFHRWQEGPTAWWPTVYLIDSDNQVRMQQRGDDTRHYARLADYIERLLAEET